MLYLILNGAVILTAAHQMRVTFISVDIQKGEAHRPGSRAARQGRMDKPGVRNEDVDSSPLWHTNAREHVEVRQQDVAVA
jgi:hypothetical protein